MLIDKDALLAAINALPDATPTSDLQAELDLAKATILELQGKVAEVQAALDAEMAKEADEALQMLALQAKLDQIKAILGA